MQKNLPKTLVSISTNPREMKILPRGNWLDDSGEIVQPAIPEFLGKLQDTGDRANRLDLANWIVSKDNPMTSGLSLIDYGNCFSEQAFHPMSMT